MSMENTEPRNRLKQATDYNKGAKDIQWGREKVFQTIMLEQLNENEGEKNETSYLTPHTKI